MWQEIRLRRLGVIEEAALSLHPGFTVVTGETGAGKTMVVTALGLLRGGRADPALVRHGAEQARVEGRVRVAGMADVTGMVDEAGGEVEDDGVIVARTVAAAGRSRAHLGGAGVPASVLAELGERLVAVHGQSDQLRLRQVGAQREALDRFAGAPVRDLLARYRPAHHRLADATAELARLRAEQAGRERELDLLRLGLAEVAGVAPVAGEDVALRQEADRLAHAQALRHCAAAAREALAGDDERVAESADVLGLLAAARAAVDGVRDHDDALAALADRVADLAYAATDLAGDLGAYVDGVEADPARLAAVQERRADLTTLGRRYGPGADEVLAWAERSAARLDELGTAEDTAAGLESEIAQLRAELGELAQALTGVRTAAAHVLGTAATEELAALAMPDAQLRVHVSPGGDGPPPDRLGPDGADDVEMLLAANAGAPPRPLGRGASGGELSRVMLALEVVLATTAPVPTFVFDEVDAGIGGKAAVEVGRRLARLARHAQVVAVTHLPQVAAFADRHYVVDKSDDGSVTTSGVSQLGGAGRVRELSRMLAGLEGSAAARAHAEELLDLAARERS